MNYDIVREWSLKANVSSTIAIISVDDEAPRTGSFGPIHSALAIRKWCASYGEMPTIDSGDHRVKCLFSDEETSSEASEADRLLSAPFGPSS